MHLISFNFVQSIVMDSELHLREIKTFSRYNESFQRIDGTKEENQAVSVISIYDNVTIGQDKTIMRWAVFSYRSSYSSSLLKRHWIFKNE